MIYSNIPALGYPRGDKTKLLKKGNNNCRWRNFIIVVDQFGLLLPIPSNRKDFVGSKITQRFLSIEHYFSDQILHSNNLKGDKVAHDSQIFTIKSKYKTNFANEKIDNFDPIEFENFKLLFEKINELIEQTS